MSDFAIKIKGYFDKALWDISRINKALELNKITQEEYNQIFASKNRTEYCLTL